MKKLHELEKLISVWLSEYANTTSSTPDIYYHIAQRAHEHAINELLKELEPLHTDAVNSIRSYTSEGAKWHRRVADRLEKFVDKDRPDQVELALEILATIPCVDGNKRFLTSAELGIIREALLSVRKDVK